MELEKALKSLTIKNDINKLSDKELRDKYMDDNFLYCEFLKYFNDMFVGRNLYPLLIYKHYDRLSELIREQGKLFNQPLTSEYILSAIEREKSFVKGPYDKAERYGQGLSIFKSKIGADRLEKDYSFEELIENILGHVTCLARSSKEVWKNEFIEYLKSATDYGSVSDENPKLTQMLLGNYVFLTHSKINLCYDPMFLVTANYLMTTKNFTPDSEFIDLVRNVIDTSENVPVNEELKPNFNPKEYHKIAKFTTKNLNQLSSEREKEKDTKRKIKSLFAKKTNK